MRSIHVLALFTTPKLIALLNNKQLVEIFGIRETQLKKNVRVCIL